MAEKEGFEEKCVFVIIYYYELYKIILIPYIIGGSIDFKRKKSYKVQHDRKVLKMTNTLEKILEKIIRCLLYNNDFKPEYAGQLNFYLSEVDVILKKDSDNPSIGLLLCKSKNNLVAEYSLRGMSISIGISEYKLTNNLSEKLEKTSAVC